MEYLLLSFFVLMVIIIIIIFLTWWQFSQLSMEAHGQEKQRSEEMLMRLINSPVLVNENSVFDDSKLAAAMSFGTVACSDLEPMLGEGWFIRVEVISNPGPDCATASDYPDCAAWELCTRPPGTYESNYSLTLPVNVFRKAESRMDLGVLTAGVYDDR